MNQIPDEKQKESVINILFKALLMFSLYWSRGYYIKATYNYTALASLHSLSLLMKLLLKLLLALPSSLAVVIETGASAKLKCVSKEDIEECKFTSPEGKVYSYQEDLLEEDGRISSLSKVRSLH